jgi:uncharacterized membrane protein
MARDAKDRNLVAAISYLLGFITVILLVEKDDRYIRFHAMQSTLIFGGLFVITILLSFVLGQIVLIGVLVNLVNTLLSILGVIVWIVSMIKAYQGQMFKWPIVGDFAERQVK